VFLPPRSPAGNNEKGRAGRLTRQTPSGALAQANSRTEEGIEKHPVERRKGSRFPDRFVDPEARSPGDSSGFWGDIPSGVCVVHPRGDGMEPPEARATSAGARRGGDCRLAHGGMGRVKKVP